MNNPDRLKNERAQRAGLTVIDVLAVGVMFVLVAAIGLPTIERARELSKRTVCSINLRALSITGASYAEANQGQWMTPAFSNYAAFGTNAYGIDYLCHGNDPQDLVCVGFERNHESRSETFNYPVAGSTAVSTTRAYWMLVRSGDIAAKQFICPSSWYDVPDTTELVDLYYDFTDYTNISYGYLVPFGPPDTRPRANADNRVIFAADKGPYYQNINFDPMTSGPKGTPILAESAPSFWQRFNSNNHGGNGQGEGQNALYADGHVRFYRRPIAGADSDNMYSVISPDWDGDGFNLIHGDSPHQSAASNPYPGKEAFGPSATAYSTTDSLIYP